MKVRLLFLFFFCLLILIAEAKKKSKIKIKKAKHVKIKKAKAHKIHAVHIGKKHHHHSHHKHHHHHSHHKQHKHHSHPIHPIHHSDHSHHSQKINQAVVPLFSPGFNGTDTGQVPADFQVQLIEDWLKRIKIVCDVFLSMAQVHSDPEEQRQVIRNLYPPVRILLEANYAHSVKLENENDPALLAAKSMATETTFSFTASSPTFTFSTPTSYYPGYVTDTF